MINISRQNFGLFDLWQVVRSLRKKKRDTSTLMVCVYSEIMVSGFLENLLNSLWRQPSALCKPHSKQNSCYGSEKFQQMKLRDYLINRISRSNLWISLVFLKVDRHTLNKLILHFLVGHGPVRPNMDEWLKNRNFLFLKKKLLSLHGQIKELVSTCILFTY